VRFMLEHITTQPPLADYDDWIQVGGFLKNRCDHLQMDPFEVWCQWNIGFENSLTDADAVLVAL